MSFETKMSARSVIHARALVLLALSATAWSAAGCSSSSSPSSEGSDDADSGSNSSSGSGSTSGSSGSSSGSTPRSGSSSSGSGVSSGGGAKIDAGANDGSVSAVDGGGDAGARDVGSCCAEQTTPGCGDPNLELCVCAKLPDCCTQAWTTACTLIVEEKYCQPQVHDCVCGLGDAGTAWDPDCCSSDWDSTCDSVAMIKCGAVQGCF